MKYLKERKLAQQELKRALGFAPKLEDIIPLESGHHNGVCINVLFTIKNKSETQYKASTDCLVVDNDEMCIHYVL